MRLAATRGAEDWMRRLPRELRGPEHVVLRLRLQRRLGRVGARLEQHAHVAAEAEALLIVHTPPLRFGVDARVIRDE